MAYRVKIKPITSFRVYPTRSGRLYFKVNIWPTKKVMHKHCFWVSGNFEAVCCSHTIYKDGKQQPEVGELNFNINRLGSGLVTHEFMHATITYTNIRKYRGMSFELNNGFVSEAEEFVCDVIGLMVSQFWKKYYKWEDNARP
jgi:hypothetical protein